MHSLLKGPLQAGKVISANRAPSRSQCALLRRPTGLARDILQEQASNIEGNPLNFLEVTEAYWKALRNQKHEPEKKGPTVVRVSPDGNNLGRIDYDVVVCGGTLGLMVGTTLQMRGYKVAVVDKRLIEGRSQEWNISRGELESLSAVGLLSPEEVESCIVSEFNPVRVGFAGGPEMWVNDCLNLGISPKILLDLVKAKFVAAGGALLEHHTFKSVDVHRGQGCAVHLTVQPPNVPNDEVSLSDVNRPNGLGSGKHDSSSPSHQHHHAPETTSHHLHSMVSHNSNQAFSMDGAKALLSDAAAAGSGGRRKMELRCRLLVDCMGHYSDIVKQMRGRAKPDGMVLVVGGAAEGFPKENNTFGDLLYTVDNAKDDMQMFWEAFPAQGGKARTTYMFAYSDAEPSRPSFEQLLDKYFHGLQQYQGVPADKLTWRRVLFGGFPCWSTGPLKPQWDHIIQIGDASATQSPLSFGGFGAMMRHLSRLTDGVDDALAVGALSRSELGCIHPYQPSLSASWLFQRSMSVGVGQLKREQGEKENRPGQKAAVHNVDAKQQAYGGHSHHVVEASGHVSGMQGHLAHGTAMHSMNNGHAIQANKAKAAQGNGNRAGAQTVPRQSSFLQLPADHVNQVLACNFAVMKVLGDRVLRPFLQDTIQLVPLSLSMMGMMVANPVAISRVLLQVGPQTLIMWFAHYFALLAYTTLHVVTTPVRIVVRNVSKGDAPLPDDTANQTAAAAGDHVYSPQLGHSDENNDEKRSTGVYARSTGWGGRLGFRLRRLFDAWEYGSGSDYRYHPSATDPVPPVNTMLVLPEADEDDILNLGDEHFTPIPVIMHEVQRV